ncbi:MAG: hypothetical protein QI197_02425 [Candidatus Korarchaeota archaeon]|nr:hypothetical protein [Candidatus Korarchaeota archaeon]
MDSSVVEELPELLSKALLEYRKKGSVEDDLLNRISSALSSYDEGSVIREHLQVVVKSLREGNFEERSLLGKSIRMDKDELLMIIQSIDRFLEEEPFKEMETKDVLQLWRESLKSVLEGLDTEVSGEISS